MRTRSSYLLSSLISAYNLTSKWEPYDDLQNDIYYTTLKKDPKDLWSKYITASKSLTSDLVKTDNFILKLHSHAFFNCYKILDACRKNNLFRLDSSDSLELKDHIDISQYDKIYFLTRQDYISNICSYLFGTIKHKLYLGDMHKIIPHHNKPITLSYNMYELQTLLIQNMLLPVFEKRLIETNLKYTKLDYNDVPAYIDTQYPDTTSSYTETKFNYKNLLRNYDQIVNVIEEEKLKFQPIVEDLLSQ